MKKVILILMLLAVASIASAVDLPALKWNKVPDTDRYAIVGYNVYWGEKSGVYPNHKNVGNVDTLEDIQNVLGLKSKTVYHFTITAYSSDRESTTAEPVSYETPVGYIPPPDTIIVKPSVPLKVLVIKVILPDNPTVTEP